MGSLTAVADQRVSPIGWFTGASEIGRYASGAQVSLSDQSDSGYGSKHSGPERIAVKTLHKFDKEIPQEAEERFQDLRDIFFKPLCDHVFKSAKKAEHMSWQLKWLGEDETNTKLYIVVACNKKSKKRIKKYFDQEHVKCELERPDVPLHFGIYVCEGLWLLAAMLTSSVILDAPSSNTHCGLAIITPERGSLRQVATLGGTIACMNNDGTSRVWGLTVGHVFHDQRRSFESSETSDSTDDRDEDSDDAEEGLELEIPHGTLQDGLQREVPRLRDLNLFQKSLNPNVMDTTRTISSTPDPLKSESGFDLDWALVKISNVTRIADASNRVLGVHRITHALSLDRNQDLLFSSSTTRDRRVIVLTTSEDGGQSQLIGALSFDPNFVKLGYTSSSIAAFSLRVLKPPSPRSLIKGDCGAWVVDAENYGVYGHVVAMDPFGDALVIPMKDILKDIKDTLEVLDVSIYNGEAISPDEPIDDAYHSSSFGGTAIVTSSRDGETHDSLTSTPIFSTLHSNTQDVETKKGCAPVDDLHPRESNTAEKQGANSRNEHGEKLPKSRKQYIVFVALCLSFFCVALDNNIISTAIPKITDDFRSLKNVGQYGSTYLLMPCVFQLLYGRFYSVLPITWTFLAALGTFEVGCLICGIAPSSIALIIGRVVAGLGAAGIYPGTVLIARNTLSPRRRSACIGMIGALYGITAIVGPVFGGLLTDRVSWRWCFYINLPFGGIAALIIVFFCPPLPCKTATPSFWRVILPHFSLTVFVPGLVCILLALQWGGSTYAWGDWRIIMLFMLSGVLTIVFIVIQLLQDMDAIIPPHVAKQRNVAAGSFFSFCLGAAFFITVYYTPIWFQAVNGVSATKSGVMNLSLFISAMVVSVLAGGIVFAVGYYTPFVIASSIFMSVGVGVLTTTRINTDDKAWIGYQILFGAGAGMGMQASLLAVVLSVPGDAPVCTNIIISAQTLGGALFVSVAQNVFENRLYYNIRSVVPSINANLVASVGATTLRNHVSNKDLPDVLVAYNSTLIETFYVAVAMAALSIVGAVLMKGHRVKINLPFRNLFALGFRPRLPN